MNVLIKQKPAYRLRKQTYGYQRGKLRVGTINWEFGIDIYTLIYITDNQQGPTVSHRELYSMLCNNLYCRV